MDAILQPESLLFEAWQALRDGLNSIVSELGLEAAQVDGGYIHAAKMFSRMSDKTYQASKELSEVFERFSPPATWGKDVQEAAKSLRKALADFHTDFVAHMEQTKQLKATVAESEFAAEAKLKQCLPRASRILSQLDAIRLGPALGGSLPRHVAVVQLDLAAYSDMTTLIRQLVKNKDERAVRCIYWLNACILGFIHQAVRAVEADESNILVSTGDGAILQFETVDKAHQFAEELFKKTTPYNKDRADTVQFHFRAGISYGPVIITSIFTRDEKTRQQLMGGLPLIDAARAEGGGKSDEVLMTPLAHAELSRNFKRRYSGPHLIAGKRVEQLEVYRRRVPPKRQPPPDPLQVSAIAPATDASGQEGIHEDIPPGMRLRRAFVVIDDIISGEKGKALKVKVPRWRDEVVSLQGEAIPPDLLSSLEKGMILIASVNTEAERMEDLFFKDFEVVRKEDLADEKAP